MKDNKDFCLDKQYIDLSDLQLNGRILDIGGGGEGIIGRLFPQTVISIDNRYNELEEAPCDTIKIVMDACEMKFLDNAFDVASCFYTLMFIRKDKWKALFAEIHRVLKTGADLVIWDTVMPAKPLDGERFIVVPISVKLSPNNTLTPSYGVLWEGRQACPKDYIEAALEAGFKLIDQSENGMAFYLRLKK